VSYVRELDACWNILNLVTLQKHIKTKTETELHKRKRNTQQWKNTCCYVSKKIKNPTLL